MSRDATSPSPDFDRLRLLFAQARQLPPSEREAFVQRLRRENAALGEELHQLLHHMPEPTQEFGMPPPNGDAAANRRTGDQVRSTETDELLRRLARSPRLDLDRHAIEGEVDRGGMGAILQIHDRYLNRRLAMKVLLDRQEPRNEVERQLAHQLLGRFLEEAQVTSQLDHPGVIPVHELGLDQQGKVYFTMQLVKGRTAREVFMDAHGGSAEWPLTRALEIILRVCDTMSFAHDKGVLHRDLKPDNVMVGPFGEVYVMDWGLAKVRGQQDRRDLRIRPDAARSDSRIESTRKRDAEHDDSSSVVSMDGQKLGTPSYMPPEQARSEELDERADVYAIGAMLYHLLTGRAPYTTPGKKKVAYRILDEVVAGPPKAIEDLQKGVPAELVAIVGKAMARELDARYPDVRALNADLIAFLEHRVVTAYEAGTWAEARKWARRNKGVVAGALVAVAALVVGALVSLQQARRADANASEATEVAALNSRLAAEKSALAESESAAKRDIAKRVREFDMLSGLVLFEEVMQRRDQLGPPWPDVIAAIDRWERDDAQPFLAMKPDVEATLLELRRRATLLANGDREEALARDPRYSEWQRLKAFVASVRRAKAVRDGAAPPAEAATVVEVDEDELDAKLTEAEALTTFDRESRASFGEEPRGLALARWLAAKTRGTSRHPRSLRVLAGALFAVGLHEEAKAVAEALLAADPDLAGATMFAESLAAQIQSFDADLGFLEDSLAKADDAMTGSGTLVAPADAGGRAATFLGRALSELVEKFAKVEKAVAEVQLRRRWAEAVRWISLDRPTSAEAWKRAREAIAAANRAPAGGAAVGRTIDLSDEKVMGLVPIGVNPRTGLWEFYDLRSAWDGVMEPADIPIPHHEEDGSIRLREETGLVFALVLPCVVRIGSQQSAAGSPLYDPMRNDNEELQTVELGAYLISRYEMTQGQWERLMTWNDEQRLPSQYHAGGRLNSSTFTKLHPVESVSWLMCTELLGKHGMQLPSEAEWEHACRAGTTTPWWSGPLAKDLAGVGNVRDRTGARVVPSWGPPEAFDDRHVVHAPVGTFGANAFGLYDVHGNVMEWCRERLTTNGKVAHVAGEGAQSSPLAACRGGGFDGPAGNARASLRALSPVEYLFGTIGLRPARRLD